MNLAELRIGNYVNHPDFETYQISFDDFAKHGLELACDSSINLHLENIKPIKLTKKRLLKFGFKKKIIKYTTTECTHYQNKNCWIYFVDGGFEFELIIDYERYNLGRVYKYIHELQNLYFALTNKELKI